MTLIQDLLGVRHDIPWQILTVHIVLELIRSALWAVGFVVVFRWAAHRTIGRAHHKHAKSHPPEHVDQQLRTDHPDRRES